MKEELGGLRGVGWIKKFIDDVLKARQALGMGTPLVKVVAPLAAQRGRAEVPQARVAYLSVAFGTGRAGNPWHLPFQESHSVRGLIKAPT